MSKHKTYNYCTLFNSAYLARGLALYNSLNEHSSNFHLYIVAFDDLTSETLKKLSLQNATVISLKEFENDELLRVKKERSIGEYCWTCTSSVIKYCIEEYSLDHCTYLDADLYFFNSPEILFDELSDDESILITEHRYTSRYDQSELSGIYCVQFMYFKNDQKGMECLNWWIDACIEWCYAIPEDGKFGDQKYLDDWTGRFEGVHVLEHLGGGMAPWNIQQYEPELQEGKLMASELKSGNQFEIIFYHFHDIKYLGEDKVDLGMYSLKSSDIKYLYKPYFNELHAVADKLKKMGYEKDPHGVRKSKSSIKAYLKLIKRRIDMNYNIHSLSSL